ncbi:hypothetical protein SETIT_2G160800v2 [Setaria italica]|uniref:Uncharacterized protein n=1 Tax=Setaria italica TaxID=4555 RepID=A0A368PZY4_SETIT|nr:hypothetical protein SETIT_2G160800v2 [Setaria italica]
MHDGRSYEQSTASPTPSARYVDCGLAGRSYEAAQSTPSPTPFPGGERTMEDRASSRQPPGRPSTWYVDVDGLRPRRAIGGDGHHRRSLGSSSPALPPPPFSHLRRPPPVSNTILVQHDRPLADMLVRHDRPLTNLVCAGGGGLDRRHGAPKLRPKPR